MLTKRKRTRQTGPRTLLGKARSKMNAVSHGAQSEAETLPGERDFEEVVREVEEHFGPANELEKAVCRRIAFCQRRLDRVQQLENSSIKPDLTLEELDALVLERCQQLAAKGQLAPEVSLNKHCPPPEKARPQLRKLEAERKALRRLLKTGDGGIIESRAEQDAIFDATCLYILPDDATDEDEEELLAMLEVGSPLEEVHSCLSRLLDERVNGLPADDPLAEKEPEESEEHSTVTVESCLYERLALCEIRIQEAKQNIAAFELWRGRILNELSVPSERDFGKIERYRRAIRKELEAAYAELSRVRASRPKVTTKPEPAKQSTD